MDFVVRNDVPLPEARIARERRTGGYPFAMLKNKGDFVDMEAEHFAPGLTIEDRYKRAKNAAREHARTKGGDFFVEVYPEEDPTTVRIWQLKDMPSE